MIIDSHMHFGNSLAFYMPKEMVLAAIKKYNISKAIVSNSMAAECDGSQTLLAPELQTAMIQTAKDAISFARENPGQIYAAIWIKPNTEQPTADFAELLSQNLDVVRAIKVHPFHSATPFNSPKVESYIKLASDLHLPVITHTATDECSKPQLVYEMAKKYPNVKFVLAHLELGSNNRAATELCAQCKNLYGDTAWVPAQNAVRFIKTVGAQKLLFGTDAPIDGLDTYTMNKFGQRSLYCDYFESLPKAISKEEYDLLMWQNAATLFGLG